MTYNVFSGTLNLTQSIENLAMNIVKQCGQVDVEVAIKRKWKCQRIVSSWFPQCYSDKYRRTFAVVHELWPETQHSSYVAYAGNHRHKLLQLSFTNLLATTCMTFWPWAFMFDLACVVCHMISMLLPVLNVLLLCSLELWWSQSDCFKNTSCSQCTIFRVFLAEQWWQKLWAVAGASGLGDQAHGEKGTVKSAGLPFGELSSNYNVM